MNKKKKHYLIYQITNNINQKFYIGKHETYNIDDNYFGSGKYLLNAIEKHGIENFTKTILFELQNREEMNLLEKAVVTPEFCAREDTYNINVGGDGGWDYCNKNGKRVSIENQKYDKDARTKKRRQTMSNWSDEYRRLHKNNCRLNALNWHQKHPGYFAGERNPMYKHIYSAESRQKMSIGQSGSKNSQYGKMWICNDKTHESRKILKTDSIPFGWRKGRFCKFPQQEAQNPENVSG